MMLFWKIRYLDRADKQFKGRCLYLHTKTLDPVTRAAVELIVENKSARTEREILKYRHLFIEGSIDKAPGNPDEWDKFNTVFLTEYFEDEAGKEITPDEMAQIITGSPTARLVPSGAKQQDIDLMFAHGEPFRTEMGDVHGPLGDLLEALVVQIRPVHDQGELGEDALVRPEPDQRVLEACPRRFATVHGGATDEF